MLDKNFLEWLANRLVDVYGESPNVDIVHKLRAIAERVPVDVDTDWSDKSDRLGYEYLLADSF